MEESTRKKQRNSSHWKNTSPFSYCSSSQVIPLGFSSTYHSGLRVNQIAYKFQLNVVTTIAKIWGKGHREVVIKTDTHQPSLFYSILKLICFQVVFSSSSGDLAPDFGSNFCRVLRLQGVPSQEVTRNVSGIRPEKVACSLVDVFQFVLHGPGEKQAKKSVFKPKKEAFLLLAITLKGVFVSIFLFVLFLFQLS